MRNYCVQRAATQKGRLTRITFFVFCMLSLGALRNFIIISQTVYNLQSRQEFMVEMAMFIGQ